MPVGGWRGSRDKESGMGLPVGMGFLTEVVALFPNSTEVVVAQQCEYTNPTGLTVHSKIISFMIYNFTRTKKKNRLTHRKGFWHMGHIKVVFSFSSIFIRQSYYGSLGGIDWLWVMLRARTQCLPFVALGREPPKHVRTLSFLDHLID